MHPSIPHSPISRRSVLLGCASLAALPWFNAAAQSDKDLLGLVGELLIPTTATRGAGGAETTGFVLQAVAHGMQGARPDLLSRLGGELDRYCDGAFLAAQPERRRAALERLDREAFGGTPSAWPQVKTLLLMGYYTSEEGASRELDYDLVPGRFEPDIPLRPGQKALSNDWTGVAIRKAGPT